MHEQWRLEGRGATAEEQTWIDAEGAPFDPQIGLVAEAYVDMQTERAVGMALGPIPWTSVIAWADFWGLDRDAAILLKRTLRVVEAEMARNEAQLAEAAAARKEAAAARKAEADRKAGER